MADIDTAGFTDIGEFGEPSIETIVELEPDLIITVGLLGDEFYDERYELLRTTGGRSS